jgi:hypothetical protein
MRSHRMHALAMLTIGIVALTPAAALAAATPPGHVRIGPNQLFVGLVNGNSGMSSHAQILVACGGPVQPGETTHPLAHQRVDVTLAPSTAANVGDTGPSATHISAFLGIPPASASAGGIATFTHYGVRKPIPTTLDVPCSGSGYITFIAFPRDPGTSRTYVVPVDFDNIAV